MHEAHRNCRKEEEEVQKKAAQLLAHIPRLPAAMCARSKPLQPSATQQAAGRQASKLTYIRCIVKLAKEIVESLNQLANGQGRRHFGKLADVSK